MAYLVDWEAKIISIPQSDLVFLSVGKYKLDLNEFRKKCRALEWSYEGLSYPPIIEFNTAVDTGDVILARVVLIINGFTVTFEDGQYAVLFDGANTNVHNFTNVNQVSIRPNNSTGLQDLSTLLSSAYQGAVVIDVINGQSGSATPIGTFRTPSNNMSDALLIAEKNGLSTLKILGLYTTDGTEDLKNMAVVGLSASVSSVFITEGTHTHNTTFRDLHINGALSNDGAIVERCHVGNLSGMKNYIYNSFIYGKIDLVGDTTVALCAIAPNAVAQKTYFDFGGNLITVILSDWGAGIAVFDNMVTGSFGGVSGTGGRVEVGSGCSGGTIIFGGSILINPVNQNLIDDIKDSSTAGAVWDKVLP